MARKNTRAQAAARPGLPLRRAMSRPSTIQTGNSENTSPNSVNPVAHAEAYRNGALLASQTIYSNKRCVANCGNMNKPTYGYGYYKQAGGFADATFTAGAWD